MDAEIQAVLAFIDRKHPNLKEELKLLSEFTSNLIHCGRLPNERLKMEYSSDGKFNELLLPEDECIGNGGGQRMTLQFACSPLAVSNAVASQPSTGAVMVPLTAQFAGGSTANIQLQNHPHSAPSSRPLEGARCSLPPISSLPRLADSPTTEPSPSVDEPYN